MRTRRHRAHHAVCTCACMRGHTPRVRMHARGHDGRGAAHARTPMVLPPLRPPTRAPPHMRPHACPPTRMPPRMPPRMRPHACPPTRMPPRMHPHTHAPTHAPPHACPHACTHTRMPPRMHAHTHAPTHAPTRLLTRVSLCASGTCVIATPCVLSSCLEMPKSESFATPREVTITLAGLRSRWTWGVRGGAGWRRVAQGGAGWRRVAGVGCADCSVAQRGVCRLAAWRSVGCADCSVARSVGGSGRERRVAPTPRKREGRAARAESLRARAKGWPGPEQVKGWPGPEIELRMCGA